MSNKRNLIAKWEKYEKENNVLDHRNEVRKFIVEQQASIDKECLQSQIDALEWAFRRNRITMTAEAYAKDVKKMIALVQRELARLKALDG